MVNFDSNPVCFSIVLLLHFVRFLKEPLNMMLLQESDKVNETLHVEHKLRLFVNCMMNPEHEIVNISEDL